MSTLARPRRAPLVLPFYHSGMGRVLPRHGRVPRAGQAVVALVGEPVPLGDLAPRCLGPEHVLPQARRAAPPGLQAGLRGGRCSRTGALQSCRWACAACERANGRRSVRPMVAMRTEHPSTSQGCMGQPMCMPAATCPLQALEARFFTPVHARMQLATPHKRRRPDAQKPRLYEALGRGQVWREITQRVCEALADLEAVAPRNWDQTAAGAAREPAPRGDVATGEAAGSVA